MIYHTKDFVEKIFVIEGKTIRFDCGLYRAGERDLEYLKQVPPHHPIYDETGRIINPGEVTEPPDPPQNKRNGTDRIRGRSRKDRAPEAKK